MTDIRNCLWASHTKGIVLGKTTSKTIQRFTSKAGAIFYFILKFVEFALIKKIQIISWPWSLISQSLENTLLIFRLQKFIKSEATSTHFPPTTPPSYLSNKFQLSCFLIMCGGILFLASFLVRLHFMCPSAMKSWFGNKTNKDWFLLTNTVEHCKCNIMKNVLW